MFIATNNAIYAVEDNGNSEPTQIYNGTGHQDLNGSGNHDAMVSLSNGQAVVSALSDGTLLFLSEDGEKRIPTGIEDPIASLLVVREDPLTLLIGTDEGLTSIVSLEKKDRLNGSSHLTNWNVGKIGTHPGAGHPPSGRLLKPKTVFVTLISMSEVSCAPPMKAFRGNPSRQTLIKMFIRSLPVLWMIIKFMRVPLTVFISVQIVETRGNIGSKVYRVATAPVSLYIQQTRT